jgi:probable O-glycosylation ligase (exosortase A-associated)
MDSKMRAEGMSPVRVEAVEVAAIALALLLGVAVFLVPAKYLLTLGLGAGLAVGMVFEPFLGLVTLLAYYFMQPGVLLPMLTAFHGFRWLILVVLGAWLLRQTYGNPRPLTRHRVNLAMFLFLGSMVVSIPLAVWPGQAFSSTIDFSKMVVLYLLVVNLIDSRRRLRIALTTIILCLGLVAGFQSLGHMGIYSGSYVRVSTIDDLQLGTVYTRSGGVAEGFLGHPDDFAVALLFAVPLSWAALTSARQKAGRAFFAALTALLTYSVLLTGSRGGAVGLLCILAFAWLSSRAKLRLAVLGLCGLTVLWYASPDSFQMRMLGLKTGEYREDKGVQARFDAWAVARQMFLEHPLTGVGAGNYETARWSAYRQRGERSVLTTHSIYFLAAAELGILGLSTFGFLIAATFLTNRRTRAELRAGAYAQHAWLVRLSYGLDASLIGYLTSGAFITVLTYPYPYLIAALAVVLSRVAQTELARSIAVEARVP